MTVAVITLTAATAITTDKSVGKAFCGAVETVVDKVDDVKNWIADTLFGTEEDNANGNVNRTAIKPIIYEAKKRLLLQSSKTKIQEKSRHRIPILESLRKIRMDHIRIKILDGKQRRTKAVIAEIIGICLPQKKEMGIITMCQVMVEFCKYKEMKHDDCDR